MTKEQLALAIVRAIIPGLDHTSDMAIRATSSTYNTVMLVLDQASGITYESPE